MHNCIVQRIDLNFRSMRNMKIDSMIIITIIITQYVLLQDGVCEKCVYFYCSTVVNIHEYTTG